MVIKFNKKIYKLNTIKSAIKDYQELADFKMSQTKEYIKVELKNIDREVKDIIKDEFCNYVLSKSR